MCRKQTRPEEWKEPWFIERYRGHCSPYVEQLIAEFVASSSKPVADVAAGNPGPAQERKAAASESCPSSTNASGEAAGRAAATAIDKPAPVQSRAAPETPDRFW